MKKDLLALHEAFSFTRMWRPRRRMHSTAHRLEKYGLLQEIKGLSTPPYKVYGITKAGREVKK